jgi:hypothetical protein
MRKLLLAVLCLAQVCGYALAEPLFASSDPPSARMKMGWRFKDGTAPGPDDKVEPPYILRRPHTADSSSCRKPVSSTWRFKGWRSV